MTDLFDISTDEEIDEFLLAAFLSRGLPPEIRREIEMYLLENSKARDILGMANEALEEAWQTSSASGPGSNFGSQSEPESESTSQSEPESKASSKAEPLKRKDYSFLRMQLWVAALPVVVVVAGLLIWSFSPNPDKYIPDASAAAMRATTWVPSIDPEKKAVSWPGVGSASRYAVVVFSPAENMIVNLETTSGTSLNDLQSFAYTFRSSDTNVLSLWVMALDVNGAVIRSSASIPLVSNRY